MALQQRIPPPERRAEALARFMTQKLKRRNWCQSVNTDTIDIRYLPTCPVTQAAGFGDYWRGCKALKLDPSSDLVLELGILPYSSYITDRAAWEVEVTALNAAHKKVIEARQANYKRYRPRLKRKLSKRKKWISPLG